MSGNNIILVGMMCSGKSAAGDALAKMLPCPFVDIDANISANSGKSIAALFASDDEKAFRRLESLTLRGVLKKGGQVIATGGGVVCTADNICRMRADGKNVVCYLRAPMMLLAKRALADDGAIRPLLAGSGDIKSVGGVLTKLFAERKALYEQAAHCIVDISPRHNENDTAKGIVRAVSSAAYKQAAHRIVDTSPRHNENDTAMGIVRAVLSAASFRA